MQSVEKVEDYSFEMIDVNNEDILAEYETGLYRAFYDAYPWYVKRYFEKIGENRLRPVIPYNDQLIYSAKKAAS